MTIKQKRTYWCGPASLHVLQLELQAKQQLPKEVWAKRQLSQEEWARVAGTTQGGTSVGAMKRCLRILEPAGFHILRKGYRRVLGLSIVYDWRRDHWMVARQLNKIDAVKLIDPEDGRTSWWWKGEFRKEFMNSKRNSYALSLKGTS